MEPAGHERLSTLRRYITVTDEMKRAEVEAL